MRLLFVVSSATLLSGCASEGLWSKPGALPADFVGDRERCKYEAQLDTAVRKIKVEELQVMCLRERGWQQAASNTRHADPQPSVSAPDAPCVKVGVCDLPTLR